MKKLMIIAALIVSVIILSVVLRGTLIHKIIVTNWPDRANELIAWVDRKSASGDLKKSQGNLGTYVFIGSYDIEVDFDPIRYGLRNGAAARVEVNADNQPLAVVFFDSTYCGIAVATRVGKNFQETFGRLPSDMKISSPRVGTFCVKRD